MPTFQTQIIRLAADTTSKEKVLDLNTSAEPQAWWARDLIIQAGVFAGQTLLDVSDLQSVSVMLKDPSNLDGAALVTQTITSFDNTTTQAAWTAGTQQHFVASIAADQLSFPLTNSARLVHLVITAITTGGKTGTICVGTINIIDDGGNSPSDNPANAITVSQAQAMCAALAWSGATMALSSGGTTNVTNAQTWLMGRQPFSAGAGTGAYVQNITVADANALAGALLRIPIDFAATLNPTINIYDGNGTLLQTLTNIDANARSFLFTAGFDGTGWHKETGEWVQ
jgi:hypothetical protein